MERDMKDQLNWNQISLELFQQISTLGLWEMNLDTREVTASAQYRKIMGIGEEAKLFESHIHSLIHANDLEPFYSEIAAGWNSNRPFEYKGRIIRPDGQFRWVRVLGMWMANDAGEHTRVFGIVQDLTALNIAEMELEQASKLLHETISRLDIVLWARDFNTKRLIYISEGCKQLFGISQEDAFQIASFTHITHPEDKKMAEEKVYSGHHELLEYRIIHPGTDEIRWIQTQVRSEKDESGQIRVLHRISIDVTDRKHSEEIIKAQNEVLSQIALRKPLSEILLKIENQTRSKLPGRLCSILLMDPERNVFIDGASPLFFNMGQETIPERPFETLHNPITKAVDLKITVIVSNIDDEWEACPFKQTAEKLGLKSCYIYPILSTEQKVVAVFTLYSQISGAPQRYELELIEAFTHLISLSIDRDESYRKISQLAYCDTLTWLYNRSYFKEHLIQSMNEAEQSKQKFALLYIDLDQFKWVNDSLGHNIGDQLLVEVAERMRSIVTEQQSLFRIGGDEFTLVDRYVASVTEALNKAEILINCFQKPFKLMDHELRIGLSIGISVYPDHGLTVNELIKHSDTTMYQAKSKGRNNANVYHTSYDDTVYERFLLHTPTSQCACP